jgi:hypothetical protein
MSAVQKLIFVATSSFLLPTLLSGSRALLPFSAQSHIARAIEDLDPEARIYRCLIITEWLREKLSGSFALVCVAALASAKARHVTASRMLDSGRPPYPTTTAGGPDFSFAR